jgi:polyferredoxin
MAEKDVTQRWRAGRAVAVVAVVLLAVCLRPPRAGAVENFPPPQFESTYAFPERAWALPRPSWQEFADVGVLVVALSAAAYIALVRRSRRAMIGLSVLAVAYFGFYRGGCVCPIGAIQGVSQAAAAPDYVLPLTVALFFALPIVFALLFGRVFCAGVCPLGAVQDLVLIKNVRLPRALTGALGVLPFVYLGGAVMLAATDTMWAICRFDPFVSMFRLGGRFPILVFGGLMLVASTFIGRPYCRFLCPYGIPILGTVSRVAWRRASITPDECVKCTLCDDACPFDAIERSTPEGVDDTI